MMEPGRLGYTGEEMNKLLCYQEAPERQPAPTTREGATLRAWLEAT